MHLKVIDIENIRIIKNESFKPINGLNIISGHNGSGKTSILEAISLLATGRTFRTNNFAQAINYENDFCRVRADASSSLKTIKIGIERNVNGTRNVHINYQPHENFLAVINYLIIQVITPEITNLVLSGSAVRRAFIDWSMFHVEQQKRKNYLLFNKLLKYRNSLLKQENINLQELSLWQLKFCAIGNQLTIDRSEYLNEIKEIFNHKFKKYLISKDIKIMFFKGWNEKSSLEQAITNNFHRDKKLKRTTVGPQLADFRITIDGKDAKIILSRGQIKLLAFLLKFAQIEHLISKTGKKPILLIDDLYSELDSENLSIIVNILHELNLQCFITALTTHDVFKNQGDVKMFHVEHGKIIK